MKKPCRNVLCIALAVLFLPVFFSCSNHAEKRSFAGNLDQIDALINQQQYREAEKLLDKIEKDAFSSWAQIGLFKRYNQINQKTKAEKILLNGIKKNPENLELLAVYTNFLTRNNRISDALNFSKGLQGTKYGSLYSEVVLRDTVEKSRKEDLKEIFKSAEYFPVYYDAYTGTGDNAWLRNCALLRLAGGAYDSAASLNPDEVFGADDAYFWSLVMYDAGRFGDSISYSEAARDLFAAATERIKRRVNMTQIASIQADGYTSLSDDDNAEEIRREYLKSIQDYKGQYFLPGDEGSESALPVIFVNSAKWSSANLEDKRSAELLSFSVQNWPDYVPALVAYADFAWNSNQQREEDFEQLALRDEGLATLEMEKYDSRAKIPVSDAIYRIDESLKRNKNPLLFVVRLDLGYKTNKNLTDIEKTADLWKVLEQNSLSPNVYPALLLDYAEAYFLRRKMISEAWELYSNHISEKYGIIKDENFWQELIRNIYVMAPGEVEYAAYYSAMNRQSEDAVRLHEYCVYENGGQEEKKIVSPYAGIATTVNLSMIYNSLGFRKQAIELYGKAAGRCSDMKIKSLIMYRMALIYYGQGDAKNARRNCEYAVTLNPRNMDAKLLLSRINK